MYHPTSASYKIAEEQKRITEESKITEIAPHSTVTTLPSVQIKTVPPQIVTGSPVVAQPVSGNSPEVNSNVVRTNISSVLGVAAINTHFFDGKLALNDSSFMSLIEEHAAKDIKENITRAGQMEKLTKTEAFQELDKFIHSQKKYSVTPNSTKCLRVIISIHDISGRTNNQNYSPSDKLHACDLLYLLYEKIVIDNNPEYLSLLLTQLDEMATGLCVQGKNNRLFQTYVMLRTDLSPTSDQID